MIGHCSSRGECDCEREPRQRQNTGNHPDPLADLERDAARWRALLAAEPRMVGTAGLEHHPDGSVTVRGDYIHADIEFWTHATAPYFSVEHTDRGRAILTAIADQIIAQGGKPKVRNGG